MKKLVSGFLIVLLCMIGSFAQSKHKKQATTVKTKTQTYRKTAYYILVARANVGQFSKKQWQQTANTLKRSGIPAFFENHETVPFSSQTRGDWLLVRKIRRLSSPMVDALALGPFNSKEAARAAVNKLPNLLSDEGRPLSEDYDGSWIMGYFLLLGVRTQ